MVDGGVQGVDEYMNPDLGKHEILCGCEEKHVMSTLVSVQYGTRMAYNNES